MPILRHTCGRPCGDPSLVGGTGHGPGPGPLGSPLNPALIRPSVLNFENTKNLSLNRNWWTYGLCILYLFYQKRVYVYQERIHYRTAHTYSTDTVINASRLEWSRNLITAVSRTVVLNSFSNTPPLNNCPFKSVDFK